MPILPSTGSLSASRRVALLVLEMHHPILCPLSRSDRYQNRSQATRCWRPYWGPIPPKAKVHQVFLFYRCPLHSWHWSLQSSVGVYQQGMINRLKQSAAGNLWDFESSYLHFRWVIGDESTCVQSDASFSFPIKKVSYGTYVSDWVVNKGLHIDPQSLQQANYSRAASWKHLLS